MLAGCGGGTSVLTPPPTPAITIDGLPSSGKLAALTTYALSVTETISGQPVTPGTVTYTVDPPALGTIDGATLKTGAGNTSGTITATDASHGFSVTRKVTVGSTHPATSGDSVAYTGKLVETIVRPLPAPVATQPPYTFTYTVSVASTTSTGKTFNGLTGLNAFTTVETDTGSTPPLPVTTTDTYQKLVASAGGTYDVLSYGSTASDTNGSTYKTSLGAGNGLLDILPETNGRTWQNTATENYRETEPDTTVLARSVKADGSYTETDTFADVTQPVASIAVDADLTGSYTNAPLRGVGVSNLTFGAPVAAGGVTSIPISIETFGVTTNSTVRDWYPSNRLYTDATILTSPQTIPATCAVPSALGTSATAIVDTTSRLDPVLGTFESRRETTYLVPFYGTACTVLSDTLTDYYDYSGQTGPPSFASVPQQVTTLSETLAFKTGSIAGATTLHAAASQTATLRPETTLEAANSRTAIEVGRASFDRVVARLYRERRRALRAYLIHTSSLQRTGR